MTFKLTPNVEVRRDKEDNVRQLRHLQQPYTTEDAGLVAPTPQSMAAAYIQDVASIYGIEASQLEGLGRGIGEEMTDEGTLLQFRQEKTAIDITAASYQQTHNGLPIWEAGLAVRMHGDSLRVISSQSSLHYEIKVEKPPEKEGFLPEGVSETSLNQILVRQRRKRPTITSTRLLIYRYDPANRYDPEAIAEEEEAAPLQYGPPILPLPEVPDTVIPGRHYVVTEVLFTLDLAGWGDLDWRAFVEPSTGSVLYLRAFVSDAFGNVFLVDPPSRTGNTTIDPCSLGTTLDPITDVVTLVGLTAPANPGDPQSLTGEFVEIQDTNSPTSPPPTASLPTGNFSFSAVTDEFAAVNAYNLMDSLYRMVQNFGFNTSTYFAGTTFPIPTDHRGEGGVVNAHHHGGSGTTKYRFGICQTGCPVGNAADYRIVIHEFGHSLLANNIGAGVFSWAHGVGDSLEVIMLDPDSQHPDRFDTFPFTTISRRHDRDIASGWAWGGTNDTGGYSSTQILSTTLFRAYRSTGGDDTRINVQRFAARYMSYLIIKAVGSLTPTTSPSSPDDFATALMDTDQVTIDFEGHPGGAFHKVIRWSFEKQDLYGGDPPDVDVYINDGRNGEYTFQSNFWNTQDLWVRNNPDGGTTHQTPIVGVPNYMYVKVKNRGTQAAENVVVNAYNCVPAAGLVWPDDWQPMTTAQLSVSGPIASLGETIIGPFEWTPQVVGHECVLASVSADGDLSNADTVNGSIPHWRLVPFDNNISQRNLAPVPGGGGLQNLVMAFVDRRFLVRNPYAQTLKVNILPVIPDFLRKRGWGVRFHNPGGTNFTLGPRANREIVLSLESGEDFSQSDVERAGEDAVFEFEVTVGDFPVGGMSYIIDPKLKEPALELPPRDKEPDCTDAAEDLLECLNLPTDEVKSVRVRRITVDIDLKDDC